MEQSMICTQLVWSGGVMKWGAEEETMMSYTSIRVRRAASTGDCKDQPSRRKEVGGEMPTHLLNIAASSRKISELVSSGKQWVKAEKIATMQQQDHISKKISSRSHFRRIHCRKKQEQNCSLSIIGIRNRQWVWSITSDLNSDTRTLDLYFSLSNRCN